MIYDILYGYIPKKQLLRDEGDCARLPKKGKEVCRIVEMGTPVANAKTSLLKLWKISTFPLESPSCSNQKFTPGRPQRASCVWVSTARSAAEIAKQRSNGKTSTPPATEEILCQMAQKPLLLTAHFEPDTTS